MAVNAPVLLETKMSQPNQACYGLAAFAAAIPTVPLHSLSVAVSLCLDTSLGASFCLNLSGMVLQILSQDWAPAAFGWA